MNNKILFIPFFILSFLRVNAQITIQGDVSFPPPEYHIKKLDTSLHTIYYKYEFIRNTQKKQNISSGLTELQIGKRFSKFVDVYRLKVDSLQKQYSRLKHIKIKEVNTLLPFFSKIKFKKTILTDYQDKRIVFQAELPGSNYEYDISFPLFHWKITKETKKMMGYTVQKAEIEYGGRKWIAWFAPEIPIFQGPYIFGNLPGLILEIHDEKNNHHFTAVAMDNKPVLIYKRNYKNPVLTTKEKYLKAEKSFHDRPDLFFDRQAVKGIGDYKKLPYNPIEIEKK